MHSLVRWAVAVCAVAATGASAQNLVIAGGVFDDRNALAVRPGFVASPNVTVKLYRDGGDGAPTADDSSVATARTDTAGLFVFKDLAAGNYWIAVDSSTIQAGAWPEQTFGPAGSLCAHPDGSTRSAYFEGSCFGGRTPASDNASSLATSEHLALVNLRESSTRVDFGFSSNAVTSTADGERVQGSLRQFVVNANAVSGPNHMRFVPLERAREQRETNFGVPPRWWSIVLGSALPELRDDDTVIDGTAHNYLSPASVVNVHPGRRGESPTIKPDERAVPRLENPELEVKLTGPIGIVCTGRCGVHALAMHGTPAGIVTRADARIEHVLLGAAPDAEASAEPGTVGVQVERGTTSARHLYVTGQTSAGIIVRPGARLDAERLDISRCGDITTENDDGGIVLLSSGSSVRSSAVTINLGPGILLGAAGSPATSNTIDGCTISGNETGVLLGPGASRNVITRNDVMWNRLGGVSTARIEDPALLPRENRFSANRFDENGLRPIILVHGTDNPNALARSRENCDRDPAAVNNGISAPRITEVTVTENENAARVVIRGRACPGEIVELYQSFVTTGVRQEKQADVPLVRSQKTMGGETIANEERELTLPSIGEFNYLGATNTQADGMFEAAFPLPITVETKEDPSKIEETSVWAREVLAAVGPEARAFSALAIDAAGNTSEMSVRRRVD